MSRVRWFVAGFFAAQHLSRWTFRNLPDDKFDEILGKLLAWRRDHRPLLQRDTPGNEIARDLHEHTRQRHYREMYEAVTGPARRFAEFQEHYKANR